MIRLFYVLLGFIGLIVVLLMVLEQDLPDVDSLKDVQMQVPLQIFTSDHKLIAEYGQMHRIPVTLDQVPPQLVNAIIATEDKRYWDHSGIDVLGLGRAAVELALTGRKSQGGSTITMQVARNFFLSRKKTYIRKLREILLALRINHELDKHKILELYINKVYLGYRSYGFAAAARVYYGKSLNQLTLPELAVLAGLPKAPSAINPIVNPKGALERRNLVLKNMYEQKYIDQATYEQAIKTPLTASFHNLPVQIDAPYVGEMVRDAMVQQYGEDAYAKGLVITTTIDSRDQLAANNSLRAALLNYDIRHGYRGPVTHWDPSDQSDWQKKLSNMPTVGDLMPAVILSVGDQQATAMTRPGDQVTIPWQGIKWAGKALVKGWKGPAPTSAGQVMQVGDVVYLNHLSGSNWALSEIPQIQGALVSLNPTNGAIQAVVGGFDFHYSKFNRATDALRQPGSSFKPFIYSAALEKGYTLASLINDAPIVSDSSAAGIWRPQNDERKFGGPTRLRVGLAMSLNLVSIRLLQAIGTSYAIDYIQKLGFDPQALPDNLTLALGTGDLTPMQATAGFAIFANGGYKVAPYFIQQVVDNDNKVIFQATPLQACDTCTDSADTPNADQNNTSTLAPRVITPQNAYLITSAMQSVIQFGTGHYAKALGRSDLAGKTGTSNDLRDTWFAGFNSDIVTVCWVGYDQPQSTHEHGAQAALPMWMDYMRQALAGKPEHTMPEPPGIVSVKIDPKTGLRARPGQHDAIFEIFRKDNVPTAIAPLAAANENDVLTATEAPTTAAAPSLPAPAATPVPTETAPAAPTAPATTTPEPATPTAPATTVPPTAPAAPAATPSAPVTDATPTVTVPAPAATPTPATPTPGTPVTSATPVAPSTPATTPPVNNNSDPDKKDSDSSQPLF